VFDMSELPAPARSVTRSVAIDRPAAEVHAFLADAANWPQWAVVNVLSAEPGSDPGWWQIDTPAGPGGDPHPRRRGDGRRRPRVPRPG
jgi:uncharacterized membrane protein